MVYRRRGASPASGFIGVSVTSLSCIRVRVRPCCYRDSYGIYRNTARALPIRYVT